MVWNVVSDFFWGYGIDPIGVLLFTVFCIYMARPLIKDFKGMPVIPIVPKLGFRTRKARQVLLSLFTLLFIVLIILFPWTESYQQLGTYDWEEVPATVEFSAVLEYTTWEFAGEELIREQLINMDYHPSDAIDFISDALKSATPDTDEWWN